MSLDIFGFRALWSPYFLIVLGLVLLGYFLITVKYRHKFADSEPLTNKQGMYFTISIILLYVIKGSPLDLMGHLMFYAHMIQMAILNLIIPILVILGIPQWIWRLILRNKWIGTIFNLFTKPVIALFFFNVTFSFYHIPLIFDHIKTEMWLHAGYTSLLFIAAICMWWPLVHQMSDIKKLSGLKKVAYIFADGALILPACALIIFSPSPLYATYSDPRLWAQALELCVPAATLANLDLSGPELFNSMSLLNDQQLGGVIMKIIQEIVYAYVLAIAFKEWYKKDKEEGEAETNRILNLQTIE